MTGPGAAPPWPDPALLDRAIGYALGAVSAITPDLLDRPTPCRGWDLRMLLAHAAESLAALQEGIGTGQVSRDPPALPGCPERDLAAEFRLRAVRLSAAWASAAGACGRSRGGRSRVIGVGDRRLPLDILAATGALEIAVHGWDCGQASGERRPIPSGLAVELLAIAPLLVGEADRAKLFAAPVAVPATASPSDRLAAFLGRPPGR